MVINRATCSVFCLFKYPEQEVVQDIVADFPRQSKAGNKANDLLNASLMLCQLSYALIDLSYNDVKCEKIHVTLNLIGSTLSRSQSNFV